MITNLQRDGSWLRTDARTAWSSAIAYAATILINGDAVVYDDKSSVESTIAAVTPAGGTAIGIGLYMKQPGQDIVPYRVKAYAGTHENETRTLFRLIIGYAPATPTGSDDIITEYHAIAFPEDGHIDDLFMLPPVPAMDSREPLAIAFGIILAGNGNGHIAEAHLSVQRLATSPPQFAQSTS